MKADLYRMKTNLNTNVKTNGSGKLVLTVQEEKM